MEVFLGNYPIATDNGAAYQRQRDVLKAAIQTYGTDHIAGMTVGNEFMLKYDWSRSPLEKLLTSCYSYLNDNANSQADPNGAIGNQGAAILISYIQDTRNMLAGLSLTKNIPVGNSDAGSYFNTKVLQAVDYGVRQSAMRFRI